MATTEVLLLKPVPGLGGEGDQVSVKAGFARNYLLPQGIADPLTLGNKKRIESLQKKRIEREANELKDAEAVAAKLNSMSVAFAVQTGEGGKLYGSITNANIADRLKEEGLEVDRRKIVLEEPVKALGKHTAKIKIHTDVTVDFSFEVVSENIIVDDSASADEEDED